MTKHWYPQNTNTPLFTMWNEQRRYEADWIRSVEKADAFMATVRDFVKTIEGDLKPGGNCK